MQLRKMADHPYLFEGVEDRSLDPNGDHLITVCMGRRRSKRIELWQDGPVRQAIEEIKRTRISSPAL